MAFDYHKHVQVTDAMLAQVQKLAKAAVAADDIVVFEATAAGTRPIKQLGSFYDGAVITRATLEAMASDLNSGAQSVPLHTRHLAGSELPIGRVFQGNVVTTMDGNYELRTLFYLPKTEATLIENINLGILDEVSVGLLTKTATCSQCGFDYFGPEAEFDTIWNRTCPNGHTLGTDGTHLNLSGVDLWSELSLVSRGASSQAKIHGRTSQNSALTERLAASGVSTMALMLSASTPTEPKEEPPVSDPTIAQLAASMAALQAKVDATPDNAPALAAALTAKTDLEAQVATLTAAAAVSAAEIVTLTASKATVDAEVVDLTAKLAAKTVGALQVDLPVGGLAATIITDATAPTGVMASFKAPKRA